MCDSFVLVCVHTLSGVMHINITNNKRHFVIADEVPNRWIVTSTATATWQNVDIVDIQLMAIGHRNRNALLLQMRTG